MRQRAELQEAIPPEGGAAAGRMESRLLSNLDQRVVAEVKRQGTSHPSSANLPPAPPEMALLLLLLPLPLLLLCSRFRPTFGDHRRLSTLCCCLDHLHHTMTTLERYHVKPWRLA